MATGLSTTASVQAEVAYEASDDIRRTLRTMGRTEDVRLSPSGTRLAVACYARSQIAVVDIAMHRDDRGPVIALSDVVFHDSPLLNEPHGLDFLDDAVLVVANRGGTIEILELPPVGVNGGATPLGSLPCVLGAVGSVAARRLPSGAHEVLAVHNWADAVARYVVAADRSLTGGEVVLHRWLDLPDGLAVSRDGRWLAISNHNAHDVLVFETASWHQDADPVGVLRGTACPHGLRFASDDRLLLVADAASHYVDVFERSVDSWANATYPAASIRVMSDETFVRGRHNPQEGGPKGLDVDERTNVLVVTAEESPLAFFDLSLALETAERRPGDDLVRQELERLRRLERSKAETAAAREQLSAVVSTKAWQATGPARAALAALKRRRGG